MSTLYNSKTVSYQFSETGTYERTHVVRDQLLNCLGFSLYSIHPFILTEQSF